MRFPGMRHAKFYFPVTQKATAVPPQDAGGPDRWYVVGLDELLVDVEVHGSHEMAAEIGLVAGESRQLPADAVCELLHCHDGGASWRRYAAGGTIANTLSNFTHLSGEPAVLLGSREVPIG